MPNSLTDEAQKVALGALMAEEAITAWPYRFAVAFVASALLASCGSPTERAAKAVERFDAAYARRDMWGARLEINRALRLADDVPEYWGRLGRVELALGQYLNAYTAYKNVLLLDADNAEAIQALAELSYSGGQPDDAIKYADQMLKREPRNLRMLTVKGSVALDRKQYDEAKRIGDAMLAIDPTNEGATVLTARTRYVTGDEKGAIDALEQSLKAHGETRARLVALLDMYLASDDFAAIERTYQRIFRLAPDDNAVALEYARNMYEYDRADLAFATLSRILRQHPKDDQVAKKVVDLWNEVGGNPVSVAQIDGLGGVARPEMRVALGRLAVDQQRYADALGFVGPLVGTGPVSPDTVEPRVIRAAALVGLGKPQAAKALVDDVLAFDDGNPGAVRVRIRTAMAEKRLDDALRDAQRLVARSPQDSGGRIALAQVYAMRGEKVLVDSAYAAGLAEIGNAIDILGAYTGWLTTTGRRDRALEVARMFTRQNPRTVAGWKLRGDLCVPARDARCLLDVIDGLSRLRGTDKARATLQAELDKLPKPPPLQVMLTPDGSLDSLSPPVTPP